MSLMYWITIFGVRHEDSRQLLLYVSCNHIKRGHSRWNYPCMCCDMCRMNAFPFPTRYFLIACSVCWTHCIKSRNQIGICDIRMRIYYSEYYYIIYCRWPVLFIQIKRIMVTWKIQFCHRPHKWIWSKKWSGRMLNPLDSIDSNNPFARIYSLLIQYWMCGRIANIHQITVTRTHAYTNLNWATSKYDNG